MPVSHEKELRLNEISVLYFAYAFVRFILEGSARVAEVVRGHGGPPQKSLDLDENFKPEHTN